METHDGPVPLVTALIRVAFLVNAAYADAGREHGVTPQQGQLLCLLRPRPYGMGELRAKLGLAKSTTTGLVEVLERDGLVRRRPGTPTPQAVQVELTADGRGRADLFYAAAHRRVSAILDPLGTVDREVAQSVLSLLVRRDDVSMIFPDTSTDGVTTPGRPDGSP